MTAVHTLKCKFKEVRDKDTLIFYYGYMPGLFGSKGREDTFSEEGCLEMIKNGEPPYQSGALKFNPDVVIFNANESRKALEA